MIEELPANEYIGQYVARPHYACQPICFKSKSYMKIMWGSLRV